MENTKNIYKYFYNNKMTQPKKSMNWNQLNAQAHKNLLQEANAPDEQNLKTFGHVTSKKRRSTSKTAPEYVPPWQQSTNINNLTLWTKTNRWPVSWWMK